MSSLKRLIKRNSHNAFFKGLAGFGRSLNRFYENRNHDVQSNGELTILKKMGCLNPKTIIDGGANIGSYALMIQKYCPKASVYAFEPVKSTYEKLVENVKPYPNIKTIAKGLYNEECNQEINIFDADTHSSIYDIEGISYSPNSKQTIELTTGDNFVADNGIEEIDLLKIDVEGAEYDALIGFEKMLSAKKIKAIQFEYGYINITTKKLLVDYYNFFEKHGYRLGKIFPKIVEFRKYNFVHEDFIGPNFIAVRADDTELIGLLEKK